MAKYILICFNCTNCSFFYVVSGLNFFGEIQQTFLLIILLTLEQLSKRYFWSCFSYFQEDLYHIFHHFLFILLIFFSLGLNLCNYEDLVYSIFGFDLERKLMLCLGLLSSLCFIILNNY